MLQHLTNFAFVFENVFTHKAPQTGRVKKKKKTRKLLRHLKWLSRDIGCIVQLIRARAARQRSPIVSEGVIIFRARAVKQRRPYCILCRYFSYSLHFDRIFMGFRVRENSQILPCASGLVCHFVSL